MKITSKTGGVVAAFIEPADDPRDLILISKKGIVLRVAFKTVPSLGRDTQGVRVMRFKEEGDVVSSVAFVNAEEEIGEGEEK
jgi:DNA gyrase subunit A